VFCGFHSVAKIVESKTNRFFGKIVKQKCDNQEYLKETKTPVLIIHGQKVRNWDNLLGRADTLQRHGDMVEMHSNLDNDMISMILKPDLEHCKYCDYNDLLVPMREFYQEKFNDQRVLDYTILTAQDSSYNNQIPRIN